MQRSDNNPGAKNTHRRVQSSTTLSRKYVKRPCRVQSSDMVVPVRRSPKISKYGSSLTDDTIANRQVAMETNSSLQGASIKEEPVASVQRHPIQITAQEKMRARSQNTTQITRKPTAKELKDMAIQKALADAAKPAQSEQNDQLAKAIKNNKTKKADGHMKMHVGFGRVLLALSCAAVAVFAIVYFVNLNMPDISLRVAAMQTGIEATYPNYVPRDYSLTDITSEDGKIILNFKNYGTNGSFSLVEEKSSWDSNALLANYVKVTFSDSYSTVREQGLTLYIDGSDAAWVNGGVVYKLDTTSGSLTKKQIKSIATSL